MTKPRPARRRRPPAASPEDRRFTIKLSRALRSAGLRGSAAEIGLEGEVLVLSGDQGGRIAIPAQEVERIRIVSYPARYVPTDYRTRIWRTGEPRSLVIAPETRRTGDYGPVMRQFAGWVFANGGEVLRGPSLVRLLAQMIWTVGSLALIALVLLGGAIVEGRWWMWLITAFVAGLAGLLFVGLYRTAWPRRVTEPGQLDEYLPPAQETRR